jgi:hypothetical protein
MPGDKSVPDSGNERLKFDARPGHWPHDKGKVHRQTLIVTALDSVSAIGG